MLRLRDHRVVWFDARAGPPQLITEIVTVGLTLIRVGVFRFDLENTISLKCLAFLIVSVIFSIRTQ